MTEFNVNNDPRVVEVRQRLHALISDGVVSVDTMQSLAADETRALIEAYLDHFRDHPPTLDDLEAACSRVGRVPAVHLVDEVETEGLLAVDAARIIGPLWSSAEFPERMLGRGRWVELFGIAGYTIDGQTAQRPTQALRLYRGATKAGRAGMAWTADPVTAAKFAHDLIRGRERGDVWTVLVEPDRLLCHNGTGERSESEYVIDPTGVTVVPLVP